MTDGRREAAWIDARDFAAIEDCCHPDSRDKRWFERGWDAATGGAPSADPLTNEAIAARIDALTARMFEQADRRQKALMSSFRRIDRDMRIARWEVIAMAALAAVSGLLAVTGWLR